MKLVSVNTLILIHIRWLQRNQAFLPRGVVPVGAVDSVKYVKLDIGVVPDSRVLSVVIIVVMSNSEKVNFNVKSRNEIVG